ncbi:unnamed protein product [Nesidiocoris tenuis]|uniref:Uncharacterized protein n=1 Tax=Nesidiocoris tenuis TaxID=355587 RepID=A0A6H5GIN2_9HEMI|nr:unnamed protein product [Nesidiocoris tenuis]
MHAFILKLNLPSLRDRIFVCSRCKPNRHVRVVNVIGNIPSVPESWLLRIVTTICSQGRFKYLYFCSVNMEVKHISSFAIVHATTVTPNCPTEKFGKFLNTSSSEIVVHWIRSRCRYLSFFIDYGCLFDLSLPPRYFHDCRSITSDSNAIWWRMIRSTTLYHRFGEESARFGERENRFLNKCLCFRVSVCLCVRLCSMSLSFIFCSTLSWIMSMRFSFSKGIKKDIFLCRNSSLTDLKTKFSNIFGKKLLLYDGNPGYCQ